jgi:capsular polysaccharide transport system ATP-binding protein
MIHLRSATKIFLSEDFPPKLVLRPTTLTLPTDRRVAILGERSQGKTSLLRLLTGALAPDQGQVITPPLSFSPIVNPGRLFHARLSGMENIRLVARMLGADADRLSRAVRAFCRDEIDLEKPLRLYSGVGRQFLEIGLVSALPFECYVLDNAHTVPPELLERCFNATAGRGAGMIYTTSVSRHVYHYADYAVVIRDGTLRAFNQVEEAIESYERKAV